MRRVAITGIGLRVGARRQPRGGLAESRRRAMRHRRGHAIRSARLSQPRWPPSSPTTIRRGTSRRSSDAVGRDAIRSPSSRLARRSRTPASTGRRIDPRARSASCSARARAICSATRTIWRDLRTKGHRAGAAVRRSSTSFRTHRWTSSATDSVCPGLATASWPPVRRARSRSGTRPTRSAPGTIDAALAGRRRRAVPADVQRLQRAAARRHRAVPAVRRRTRRDDDRRSRGRARARGSRSRQSAAARRSTPSWPATARRARPTIRRRRSRKGTPSRRPFGPRSPTRGSRPTPSITSTRTARARCTTTAPRRAAFHRVFGDRTRIGAGQRHQVDDRPLPRRGRRHRGRGAGADHRARRHPADRQPSSDRSGMRARRRAERGPRAARSAAASRRRWPLAATTRRW